MPSDPTTFQRLMQAMATRYAGKVKVYELWNEENLVRETGQGNVDPSTYLPLAQGGLHRHQGRRRERAGLARGAQSDGRQPARRVDGRPGRT